MFDDLDLGHFQPMQVTPPPKQQRVVMLGQLRVIQECAHRYIVSISMGMRETPEQRQAVSAAQGLLTQTDALIAALQSMNAKHQNETR